MEILSMDDLSEVNGGVNYGNLKIDKLKKSFESACRVKNINKVLQILPELQARGEYAWAREMAHKYGINSI